MLYPKNTTGELQIFC